MVTGDAVCYGKERRQTCNLLLAGQRRSAFRRLAASERETRPCAADIEGGYASTSGMRYSSLGLFSCGGWPALPVPSLGCLSVSARLTRDPLAGAGLPKPRPEQPQDAAETSMLLVALDLLRASCTEDDVDPDRRPTSAAPRPAWGERCTKA